MEQRSVSSECRKEKENGAKGAFKYITAENFPIEDTNLHVHKIGILDTSNEIHAKTHYN